MNNGDAAITILIVDDHALVREGLREILQSQDDIHVVGEAADSVTTVALAAERQPDIVLLDVEIPGGGVTATVAQIRARSPRSRVIILSMYEGPQLVQALLDAGIRGYLLKSIHWQELVVGIRAVCADDDRIVLGVSRESLSYVQQGPAPGKLSDRERDVLDLVAQALSNSQIAARLHLTEATVKRHLRNVFVKLGAVSRLDAVNKARQRQETDDLAAASRLERTGYRRLSSSLQAAYAADHSSMQSEQNSAELATSHHFPHMWHQLVMPPLGTPSPCVPSVMLALHRG
jgi:DNA-binding NarL/FixJ family response regulator